MELSGTASICGGEWTVHVSETKEGSHLKCYLFIPYTDAVGIAEFRQLMLNIPASCDSSFRAVQLKGFSSPQIHWDPPRIFFNITFWNDVCGHGLIEVYSGMDPPHQCAFNIHWTCSPPLDKNTGSIHCFQLSFTKTHWLVILTLCLRSIFVHNLVATIPRLQEPITSWVLLLKHLRWWRRKCFHFDLFFVLDLLECQMIP